MPYLYRERESCGEDCACDRSGDELGGHKLFLIASLASSPMSYIQVNCAAFGNVAVPFGGYKQSGVGKEMGKHALDTCVLVLFFCDTRVCMLMTLCEFEGIHK